MEINQKDTVKLEFKVEKMFILQGAGLLKAFANLSINDSIIICGLRIMEGKKGLFVTMPREQGKDNKWYDQILYRDAETFDAVCKVMLDYYEHQISSVKA